MAQFLDIPATELFGSSSRVLFTGLTDTVTRFENWDGEDGFLLKENSWGKELWRRPASKGPHAYRVTADGVKELPLIEDDWNVARRLARTLNWSLTRIIDVSQGERVRIGFHPMHRGDDGYRHLDDGERIAIRRCVCTLSNPAWIVKILVDKDNLPTWEDAQMALELYSLMPFDDAVAMHRRYH